MTEVLKVTPNQLNQIANHYTTHAAHKSDRSHVVL